MSRTDQPAFPKDNNEACGRFPLATWQARTYADYDRWHGVDISTVDLALEAARLGGWAHSDAMINTVADRRYDTKYVKEKLALYKFNVKNEDKSVVKFDLATVAEATCLHVESAMSQKKVMA